MSRFEQYEVWQLHGDRWEHVAAFHDVEVASAMAHERPYCMRVMRVAYEDGRAVEEEILVDVGATRKEP